MFATQIFLCVAIVGDVVLVTMVLSERRSTIRTAFALYAALLAAWAFSIYLNIFLKSVLIEESVFAIGAAALTTQVWFAKLFPDETLPKTPRGYWTLAIGCFFTLASFYPGALFHSITVHQSGYTIHDNGFLSDAYSLFAFLYVLAPIAILLRKYRAATADPLRRQLYYLGIGSFLFATIVLLTNSVLPILFHVYRLNAIGPSFSLLFCAFVFYIIARHEFLNIRKAVQRGVIYSFLIAAIIAAYELSLLGAERYLASVHLFFAWEDDVVEPLTASAATFLGIFTIPVIERYVQKLTDRLFFKDQYDYAAALESLSRILRDNVDFDQLIAQVRKGLFAVLRAESLEFELYDDKSKHDIEKKYGAKLVDREMLFEPIKAGGKEIGGILVGEKSSGDRYEPEDAQLLRTFSMQASTALARATLFRQVQEHALELEKKVTERTAQLEQAHERERQTMLDIAHGFQTPLAIFRTKLEKLKPSGQEKVDIAALEQSLDHLSDLVGNLLKLAQLEHAGQLHFSDCSLSELMQEVAEEAAIVGAARGISLTSGIESGITIRADAGEFKSAVMNLVSNSMKYMRESGPRSIDIRLERQNGGAVLSIRDTGIGIEARDLPHIFERFYRAKRGADAGGGGLGLAISKKIFERHGGTVTAESDAGKGTTMTVRLPCLRRPKPAA